MKDEKRMAGSYEIIQAFHFGPREIVIGEDKNAAPGEHYMCAYHVQNGILSAYEEIELSDDYGRIVVTFGDRLLDAASGILALQGCYMIEGIDITPLTSVNCTLISSDDDLDGKVVVIKPEVLRPEYRIAIEQIVLCTGGFGAHPHSRGNACYCKNLYYGTQTRFERQDILGTLEPEKYPQWVKSGLELYQQEQAKKRKERER